MVGLLIIVAMLGGLYYALQGGAGMAFGGSRMAGMAIIGIVSIVVLVLIAFLILPELGDVLKNHTPAVPWDMPSGRLSLLVKDPVLFMGRSFSSL
jgi:hypothetical protein